MEITTYPLSKIQLVKIMPFMISFFEKLDKVQIMCGWEMNNKKEYEYFTIPFSDLNSFISSSLKEGLFELGSNELFIKDNQSTLEILFCNDSDVHLRSSEEAVLERMKIKLKDMNIQYTLTEKGKL